MEFVDVLRRRRMVRNYTDEPVSHEALDRITRRARHAPSGGFSQGLRMVVVTDPDTRRLIAVLADEPGYVELGFEPWISRFAEEGRDFDGPLTRFGGRCSACTAPGSLDTRLR